MNGRNLFLVKIVTSFKISEEDEEAIKQYLYDTVNKPLSTPSMRKKHLQTLNSNLKKLGNSIENLRDPNGQILELSKVRVIRRRKASNRIERNNIDKNYRFFNEELQGVLSELLEWSNDTFKAHEEITKNIKRGRPSVRKPFEIFINRIYWNFCETQKKLVGVSANQDKDEGGPLIKHVRNLLNYIKKEYREYYDKHEVVKRDCNRSASSIRQVYRSIKNSGVLRRFI